MLTKAEIKQYRSLSDKKFRDEYGCFLVEGEKLVREALDSGWEVLRVLREDESTMSRISALSSPPPVAAVVRKPAPQPLAIERGALCLALDAVRDPGNAGTLLRTADWFGIGTVLLSPDCVDVFNPKAVQASMGSIFRVKTVICNLPGACRRFREAGMEVYGTFIDGEDIYAQELAGEGLVIMGSESFGIGPELARCVSRRLSIPSFGGAESLNVAAAAAVTLSEFRRRRR